MAFTPQGHRHHGQANLKYIKPQRSWPTRVLDSSKLRLTASPSNLGQRCKTWWASLFNKLRRQGVDMHKPPAVPANMVREVGQAT